MLGVSKNLILVYFQHNYQRCLRPNNIKMIYKRREIEYFYSNMIIKFQALLAATNDKMKEKLKSENLRLKLEVERLKSCLLSGTSQKMPIEINEIKQMVSTSGSQEPPVTLVKPTKSKSNDKEIKTSSKATTNSPTLDNDVIDVGRLDFRIGHILEVNKHPDADSLYVEKINVGEDNPRTVVSGLVKHMPPQDLQGKMVVLLCNLKPAKMRGITSEAMVMCASTPEKVEILIPPEGSVPGDVVEFEGFKRVPDKVLNPKKKIFETCAPDLRTNGDLIATYKGVSFTVLGKGVVKTTSLANVQIK